LSISKTTFQDLDLGKLAKQEARRRRLRPTLEESLSRWWSEKYKLPSNHELFQNQTILELLTEFWLDHYYHTPLEVYRNEDGQVVFSDTGDELIDKWEKELAEGKTPDYLEGFSNEQLERLHRLRTHGVDQFRRRVPSTFLDTSNTVVDDAIKQGLGAGPPSRFSNLDSPE
jgi:hypothetical protein